MGFLLLFISGGWRSLFPFVFAVFFLHPAAFGYIHTPPSHYKHTSVIALFFIVSLFFSFPLHLFLFLFYLTSDLISISCERRSTHTGLECRMILFFLVLAGCYLLLFLFLLSPTLLFFNDIQSVLVLWGVSPHSFSIFLLNLFTLISTYPLQYLLLSTIPFFFPYAIYIYLPSSFPVFRKVFFF